MYNWVGHTAADLLENIRREASLRFNDITIYDTQWS